MGRVRHAGYLKRKENGFTLKHWCVVRDQTFIVYPQKENLQDIRADSDGSPILCLPVDEIKITVIESATIDRFHSEPCFSLLCATKGIDLMFYTNHAASPEKWQAAIEDETSRDAVTPKNLPRGAPLPPEISPESMHFSKISTLITPFSSKFGIETLSMRYLDNVRRENKKLTEANKASTNVVDSCFPKNVSKTSTNGDIVGSKNSIQRPNDAKVSSSRQKIHPLTQTHLHGLNLIEDVFSSNKKSGKFENSRAENSRTALKSLGSVKGLSSNQSDKFNKVFRPKKYHTVGGNSRYRQTTCDSTVMDERILRNIHKSDMNQKTNHKTTKLKAKSVKPTIAPLSSLDFNLKQRKKKRRPGITVSPETLQIFGAKEESSTDEEETILVELQKPCLASTSIPGLNKDIIDNSRSQVTDSRHNLQDHIYAKDQSSSLSNLHKSQTSSADDSKVSKIQKFSTFTRVLGSKRNKRSTKSVADNPEHELVSENMLDQEKIISASDVSFDLLSTSNDGHYVKSDQTFCVLMEGWLYRKKLMSWSKQWSVLSSDKTLRFYKLQPCNDQSQPLLSLDLHHGCNVENIEQGKNFNTFWLYPSNKALSEQRFVNCDLKDNSYPRIPWKPIHLMCKNTQEFVHWMKQFVLLDPCTSLITPKLVCSKFSKSMEVLNSPQTSRKPHEDERLPFSSRSVAQRRTSIDDWNIEKSFTSYEFLSNVQHNTSDQVSRNSADDALSMFVERKTVFNPLIQIYTCDEEENEIKQHESSVKSKDASKQKTAFGNLGHASAAKSGETGKEFSKQEVSSERPFTTTNDYSPSHQQTAQPIIDNIKESEAFSLNTDKEQLKLSPTKPFVNQISRSQKLGNETDPERQCVKGIEKIDVELNKRPKQNSERAVDLDTGANIAPVINHSCCEQHTCICYINNSKCQFRSNSSSGSANYKMDRKESADFCKTSSDVKKTFSLAPFSQRNICKNVPNHFLSDGVVQGESNLLVRSIEGNLACSLDLFDANARIRHFESLESINSKELTQFQSGIKTENQNQFDQSHSNKSNFSLADVFGKESASQIRLNLHCGHYSSVCNLRCAYSKEDLSEITAPLENNLRRSTSDSNLLEPSLGQKYKMRRSKIAVPELSKIDFIEMFGDRKHVKVSSGHFGEGNKNSSETNKRRNSVESDDSSVHPKDFSDGSSSGSTSSESKVSKNSNKKIAMSRVVSDPGLSNGKGNWFFGVGPKMRNGVKRSQDNFKKSSKGQVIQIAASQLKTASHRGYLDKRNKRRQWEKFWCVFQDACLYIYNSPQSDATRDTILLRGYDVAADVRKTNCQKYEFRLVQAGSPTLYFSSNNFEEYLFWVATLEREARSMQTNTQRKLSEDSPKETNVDEPVPIQTSDSSSTPSPVLVRNLSDEQLENEIVQMQKHKLLKELASQQEKLLIEQKMIARMAGDNVNVQPKKTSKDRRKKEEVIRKFQHARIEEEAKATKNMTFLNRRRNSAQLKLDQLTKELAPKSGKKRRDDHKHFAALESKQHEMKEKLAEIDKEIIFLQSNKQNAMEKIRERQELELILADQQDALEILLRRKSSGDVPQFRKRHQSRESRKTLSSIDEIVLESDNASCSSTDSYGSESRVLRTKLTFFDEKSPASPPPVFENRNKELHPISILRSFSSDFSFSDSNYSPRSISSDNLSKTSASLSSSTYSLKDGSNTSNFNPAGKSRKTEIDASVIANIEDFEQFSTKMLAKLNAKTSS